MTTVAIHQPNYLPWAGYFAKIARADVFVLLDTVPFTKNSWQNRVQVKGSGGPLWLTQPVLTSGRSGQATRDVEFPRDDPWRVKHVKTLDACYGRSPHYEEVFGAIADLYRGHETHLAPFNEALIGRITDYLGIPTPIRRASELGGAGTATDLLVDLVQKAGGDTYLSGQGGRKYQDEAAFADAGIRLTYLEFEEPEREQPWGDFVPGLSVVDLLVTLGRESAAVLRGGG